MTKKNQKLIELTAIVPRAPMLWLDVDGFFSIGHRPNKLHKEHQRDDTAALVHHTDLKVRSGEETASAGDVKASNARRVRAIGERSDGAKDADHAGQNPDGCQMR
jgi:hypothetical protein